jgi:hypothetical protein
MHLEQHRETASAEAGHEVQLPQRAGAWQRADHQLSSQGGGLGTAVATIEMMPVDVVLHTVSGIVDPRRGARRKPGRLYPLTQLWELLEAVGQQCGHSPGMPGCPGAGCSEDRQRTEVHR